MSLWVAVPLTVLGSLALWAAGAVVFDGVHWVLHGMLRSRSRILRALAWPHGVHHEWLDRTLTTRWELQWMNVWCHLVPEYLTQLAFSAVCSLVLPGPVVVGCVVLQTAIFIGLLSYRGLDINHRAVTILDAHQPSVMALPAYHALHHVYPEAHFSAYGKLVDWVVGGGTAFERRRAAVVGSPGPIREAFETAARAAPFLEGSADDLEALDVLVIADPAAAETTLVEDFIAATRARQLPPEVWAIHDRPNDPLARHYMRDVRVIYRHVVVPPVAVRDLRAAERAARIALSRIRRGFHFVTATSARETWRAFRSFQRVEPRVPEGAILARSRAALTTS